MIPLALGTVVSVQNQTGPHKLKWDKSGTVVEVLDFHQYRVKMDGSGRVSLRNSAYLRPIAPYTQLASSPVSLVRTRFPVEVHKEVPSEPDVEGRSEEHQESLEPRPRREEGGTVRQSTQVRRAPIWFVPGG